MLKLPVLTQQIKHFKVLFDARTYSTFQAVIRAIISLRDFKQADLARFSAKTLRQVQYFFGNAKWCAIKLNELRLRFLRNKPDFRDRRSDFVVADGTTIKKDKNSVFNNCTDVFWSNLHKQTVNGFEIFGVSVQTKQGVKYILDFMFFLKNKWQSEAQGWMHLLNKISQKTKAWIFIFDAGFRKQYLLEYVYKKLKRHFLVRLSPIQHVLGNHQKVFCNAQQIKKQQPSVKVTDGRLWILTQARVKAWDKVIDFPLTVIIYQKNGFRNSLVLAVSQAELTTEEALAFVQLYFQRWGIEQIFKELKSYLAFEKFKLTSLFAIKKYLMLMILIHSILTLKKQELTTSPPLKLLAEFVLKKLRNIKKLTVIGVKFFLEITKSLTSLKWFSAYVKAKKLRLCMRFL